MAIAAAVVCGELWSCVASLLSCVPCKMLCASHSVFLWCAFVCEMCGLWADWMGESKMEGYALSFALDSGQVDVVEALLEAGAYLDVVNPDPDPEVWYACDGTSPEAILLRSHVSSADLVVMAASLTRLRFIFPASPISIIAGWMDGPLDLGPFDHRLIASIGWNQYGLSVSEAWAEWCAHFRSAYDGREDARSGFRYPRSEDFDACAALMDRVTAGGSWEGFLFLCSLRQSSSFVLLLLLLALPVV